MTTMLGSTRRRLPRLRRPRIPMPLLVKELTEQAARRRTYLLRLLFAVVFYGLAALVYRDTLRRAAGNSLGMLGKGKELFELLVAFQFFAIHLLLPALIAGVVTVEKERRTLTLLLLTDLRPTEIVIQKLLGRMTTMLTLLLLSLPLMAVIYSFAGVRSGQVAVAAAALLASCLQVGALAMLMSCWCRTTAGALVGTYLVGALLFVGPFVFVELNRWFFRIVLGLRSTEVLLYHWAPMIYLDSQRRSSFGPALWSTAFTLLLLLLARCALVGRAEVRPRNYLLLLFRWLDASYQRSNWLVGNVVLWHSRETLPGDRPIAWMELNCRAMGKTHYLLRLLVTLQLPVVMLVLALLGRNLGWRTNEATVLSAAVGVIWPFAAILLVVLSAGALAGERGRQSLEVLLTLPWSGREIVLEKTAALRRLMLVLATPLATLYLVEWYWEHATSHVAISIWPGVRYLAGSALTLAVYLPLVMWLGLLIGMWICSQSRAVMTSVLVLLGLVIAPALAGLVVQGTGRDVGWWQLLSPATYVVISESDLLARRFELTPWWALVVNFVIWGSVAAGLRLLCLRRADVLLGRVAETGSSEPGA